MLRPAPTPPPAPALLLSSDLDLLVPSSHAARSGVQSGQLVRLHRGVYLSGADWNALTDDEKYVARIHAAVLGMPTMPVVSHHSAAALWGLPVIGPWPSDVHVTVHRATGGRSDPGVRRHAVGVAPGDVTSRSGLLVTTLARTVVDMAAVRGVHSAVATTDAAIHNPRYGSQLIDKRSVLQQWEQMVPFLGHARAKRVVDFADEQSGSTSESASRTSIALLGFPEPELQRHFVANGEDAWTDFYWDLVDGIGECDGLGKYTDPNLRNGKSIEEVVVAERRRENALRRQVTEFVRWDSADALSLRRMHAKMLELGLRQHDPRLSGR